MSVKNAPVFANLSLEQLVFGKNERLTLLDDPNAASNIKNYKESHIERVKLSMLSNVAKGRTPNDTSILVSPIAGTKKYMIEDGNTRVVILTHFYDEFLAVAQEHNPKATEVYLAAAILSEPLSIEQKIAINNLNQEHHFLADAKLLFEYRQANMGKTIKQIAAHFGCKTNTAESYLSVFTMLINLDEVAVKLVHSRFDLEEAALLAKYNAYPLLQNTVLHAIKDTFGDNASTKTKVTKQLVSLKIQESIVQIPTYLAEVIDNYEYITKQPEYCVVNGVQHFVVVPDQERATDRLHKEALDIVQMTHPDYVYIPDTSKYVIVTEDHPHAVKVIDRILTPLIVAKASNVDFVKKTDSETLLEKEAFIAKRNITTRLKVVYKEWLLEDSNSTLYQFANVDESDISMFQRILLAKETLTERLLRCIQLDVNSITLFLINKGTDKEKNTIENIERFAGREKIAKLITIDHKGASRNRALWDMLKIHVVGVEVFVPLQNGLIDERLPKQMAAKYARALGLNSKTTLAQLYTAAAAYIEKGELGTFNIAEDCEDTAEEVSNYYSGMHSVMGRAKEAIAHFVKNNTGIEVAKNIQNINNVLVAHINEIAGYKDAFDYANDQKYAQLIAFFAKHSWEKKIVANINNPIAYLEKEYTAMAALMCQYLFIKSQTV